MNGFLDTSVLVPVLYGDHVHHRASLDLFIQFDKSTGCCGAHSLAEVYSTLTRMPGKHRIGSEQAILFIENIRERLSVTSLDGDEYAHALEALGRARRAMRVHRLSILRRVPDVKDFDGVFLHAIRHDVRQAFMQ